VIVFSGSDRSCCLGAYWSAANCATLEEFEQRLADLPEVLEVYRLFGEPDYLLRIGVADVSTYERLCRRAESSPGRCDLIHPMCHTSHVTMKR
jgi:Lrp/AsnC family transcriptional regulator, leucine-responsive regulatory protein